MMSRYRQKRHWSNVKYTDLHSHKNVDCLKIIRFKPYNIEKCNKLTTATATSARPKRDRKMPARFVDFETDIDTAITRAFINQQSEKYTKVKNDFKFEKEETGSQLSYTPEPGELFYDKEGAMLYSFDGRRFLEQPELLGLEAETDEFEDRTNHIHNDQSTNADAKSTPVYTIESSSVKIVDKNIDTNLVEDKLGGFEDQFEPEIDLDLDGFLQTSKTKINTSANDVDVNQQPLTLEEVEEEKELLNILNATEIENEEPDIMMCDVAPSKAQVDTVEHLEINLEKSGDQNCSTNSEGEEEEFHQYITMGSIEELLKRHDCPECDHAFYYRADLLEHIVMHHGEDGLKKVKQQPLIPPIEQRNLMGIHPGLYGYGDLLEDPFAEERDPISEEHGFYGCKFCDRVYTDNQQRLQHEKLHLTHGSLRGQGFKFRTRASHSGRGGRGRSRHLVGFDSIPPPENGPPYKCEFCDRWFDQLDHWRKHSRTHTGDKPYECRFCGRRFSQSSIVYRHERIHTGEKPYSCRYCEKSFADLPTRQMHERLHTGERPYQCRFCSERFLRQPSRKLHEKQCIAAPKAKDPTDLNEGEEYTDPVLLAADADEPSFMSIRPRRGRPRGSTSKNYIGTTRGLSSRSSSIQRVSRKPIYSMDFPTFEYVEAKSLIPPRSPSIISRAASSITEDIDGGWDEAVQDMILKQEIHQTLNKKISVLKNLEPSITSSLQITNR